jgi:hypothetical protein
MTSKIGVVAAIALAAIVAIPSASYAAKKHKDASDPTQCTGGACTAQNPDRVTQPCNGSNCYKSSRKHKKPAEAPK